MSNYKEGGLEPRYKLEKTNGEAMDADAKYFILRYDKDPHAQVAILAYAKSVENENPQLSRDLIKEVDLFMQLRQQEIEVIGNIHAPLVSGTAGELNSADLEGAEKVFSDPSNPEYSDKELDCMKRGGCMGPCGMCDEVTENDFAQNVDKWKQETDIDFLKEKEEEDGLPF